MEVNVAEIDKNMNEAPRSRTNSAEIVAERGPEDDAAIAEAISQVEQELDKSEGKKGDNSFVNIILSILIGIALSKVFSLLVLKK